MVARSSRIGIFLRFVLKTLAVILGLLCVYLMIAFICGVIGVGKKDLDCEPVHTVYLVSNEIHLNLVIPVDLLDTGIKDGLDLPPEVQFLSFGWGDKEFYIKTPTWDDLEAGVALRAVFVPSASAIHTTYYRNTTSHWIPFSLCDTQLEQLNTYIQESFDRDDNGGIIEIPHSGYTQNDRFFEARGMYSLFNTCNDWINRGLKEADVRTALWSPFKYGVLYHVDKTMGDE